MNLPYVILEQTPDFSGLNSMYPGRGGCDFEYMNFKRNMGIDIMSAFK